MAFPSADSLAPDRLYLIVLGPGTGETVLVRVPPDLWLIVDSFQCGTPRRAAAMSVVEHFGGRVAALVLTHPHTDHYYGMLELIDAHESAILGCVHPQDSSPTASLTNDPVVALQQGAKPVYDRIWTEWNNAPSRRWDTFRNEGTTIGEATVTSLHPERPVSPEAWGSKSNAISSAMMVKWQGVRILLGADVPNSEWPAIAADFPQLGNHIVMKVPHHGSRDAIHESFGAGDLNRTWLVTPFQKQRLPRAADLSKKGEREGLASILHFVDHASLTALPIRHDRESDDPCRTTRQAIRDNKCPVSSGQMVDSIMTSDEALNRFIIVEVQASGEVKRVYGPGSVEVREANE